MHPAFFAARKPETRNDGEAREDHQPADDLRGRYCFAQQPIGGDEADRRHQQDEGCGHLLRYAAEGPNYQHQELRRREHQENIVLVLFD